MSLTVDCGHGSREEEAWGTRDLQEEKCHLAPTDGHIEPAERDRDLLRYSE